MSIETCARKLSGFFKHHLSAELVFDLTFAREISLIESQREFVNRFRENKNIPVLTSSCPGWICYAEKTHGSFILPYISNVKSSQQVMGTLLKDYLSKSIFDTTPDTLYHVSIAPCYDKKLEASRADFQNKFHNSKDVDCVISTIEIEQLLQKESLDLNSVQEESIDIP